MAAETPVISGKNGGRQGEAVYCSRCGAQMADGALLCSGCGQVFSTGAALARPMSAQVVSSAPRVHYGGFWLRFLAYLIDGAVITLGAFVVAIPLVFLTGLGTLLSQVHPEEDLNDAGFWLIMAVVLFFVAGGPPVGWVSHSLVGGCHGAAPTSKKGPDLVVAGLEGGRRLVCARAAEKDSHE